MYTLFIPLEDRIGIIKKCCHNSVGQKISTTLQNQLKKLNRKKSID